MGTNISHLVQIIKFVVRMITLMCLVEKRRKALSSPHENHLEPIQKMLAADLSLPLD